MNGDVPNKRHPFIQGDECFDFGVDEIVELTDEQKVARFYSKFVSRHNPIKRYSSFFNDNDVAITFRNLKLYYKNKVIGEGWSEKKYDFVMCEIMNNRAPLNKWSIEKFGEQYDSGKRSRGGVGRRRTVVSTRVAPQSDKMSSSVPGRRRRKRV